MISALAMTLFGAATIVPVRPALGSSELEVARVSDPTLSADGARADAWQRKALVARGSTEVRVLGPSRPVPTRAPGALTVDATEALAVVAALGWPGATTAELVITRSGVPAWRIDPPASLLGPSNPVFLVDARNGRAWVRHDRVLNESISAFEINPALTPDAQTFELIDFDPLESDGDLRGERLAVFNCTEPEDNSICGYEEIGPSDPSGDFLHPAPDIGNDDDNRQLEDAFAVQSVYHHADVFLAYLDGLGIPPIGCLDEGSPLVLVANYKAYLPAETVLVGNASYLGDCGLLAAFGQGPEADYGYDGDVVYHELTHGVVEVMMDGGFLARRRHRADAVIRDAGAINEGTADFFAAVYTGNPTQAEYVAARKGVPSRTADNTLTCPASLTGEVHADGELWSGALWEAYQSVGDPLLGSLLDAISLLPEDATFEEASTALVDVVTEELGDDAAAAVMDAVGGRGLLDCPRIIPWDAVERGLWLRPRGQEGTFTPMQPAPAQIAVDVPADAVGFVLRFDVEIRSTPGFTAATELHALVKWGAPVTFTYADDDEGFTNVEAEPDLYLPVIDEQAMGDGIVIDAPGGQTAYVGVFNQSANITVVSAFDVEFLMGDDPATTGDDDGTGDGAEATTSAGADGSDGDGTGGAGAASDDSGCACGVQSPRPLAGLTFAMLALASVRRRRRRSAWD